MHISKTIPSQLELIDAFISSLLARLSHLSLNQNVNFNIKLALHEAIVNAVKHGNKMNSHLLVSVDITVQPNQIAIQVADQGNGFDYKSIPDPITPENLWKLSGRGIFLIQNAMDKIEFENEGRTIRMIKFLKQ
jgi:serine/threonine-protein kinase RsbW